MYGKKYLNKVIFYGKYLADKIYSVFSDILKDLIKNCGLEAYWTISKDYEQQLKQNAIDEGAEFVMKSNTTAVNGELIDEIGDVDRVAVLGQELVGDGSTYVNTKIIPNQDTVIRVWGNFNSLSVPSADQRFGQRTSYAVNESTFGITNNKWRMVWGSADTSSVVSADILKHKFEMINGLLKIDDIIVTGTDGNPIDNPTNFLRLLSVNANGSNGFPCNFNLDACEIDHDGVTYTLNLQEYQHSTNEIPLNGSDGTIIMAEQFVSPAIPVIDSLLESDQDKVGVSFSRALGKNLYNDSFDTIDFRLDHTTGGLIVNPGGRTSGFIFIDDFSNIFTNMISYTFYRIVFYDVDKIYISGFQAVNPVVIPSNAKYFRFSNVGGSFESETQSENNTVATTYEPFTGFYTDKFGVQTFEDGTPIQSDDLGKAYAYTGDKELVVIPQEIVGDGATYIEAIGFTDADLPTNYEIEGVFIYNDDVSLAGFFGTSSNSAEDKRYYLSTDNADNKDIVFGFFDTVQRFNVDLSIGDTVSFMLSVTGESYSVTVNDESASGVGNKVSIGQKLVLLSRSFASTPSNHKILSFKIKNTDTNETLTLNTIPDSNNKYQLVPSNPLIEPIICEQFIAPVVPTVDNYDAEDMLNVYGYTNAVRNEVDNYDFSDGVNGWSAINSSLTESNNVLSIEGDGVGTTVTATQTLVDKAVLNDEYFVFYRARVTNSLSSVLRMRVFATGATDISELTPTENVWYDKYDKITGSGDGNITLQISHIYSDAPTANGKIVEVEGDISKGGGVFALNLTEIDKALETSYSSMTASQVNDIKYEILALQQYLESTLDTLYETGYKIPNYSDGITSIGFNANGQHPLGQYQGSQYLTRPDVDSFGSIKKSMRIVDGKVDNGKDYEKWEVDSGSSIVNNIIKIVQNTAVSEFADNQCECLKGSTDYTLVYNIVSDNLGAGILRLDNLNAFTAQESLPKSIGENRILVTTISTITDNKIRLNVAGSANGEYVELTDFKTYEGDYATDPLSILPIGEYDEANSVIWNDNYGGIYEADTLNATHVDGVNKVIPISDLKQTFNRQWQGYTNTKTGELISLQLYDKQVSDTGLDQIVDKVGKNDYTATPGETLLGDGITYVDTKIIPNQTTALRVWGNFNDAISNQQIGSRKASSERFYFGVNGLGKWIAGWEDLFEETQSADELKHKFELVSKGFYIDDNLIYDFSGAQDLIGTYNVFLNAVNRDGLANAHCNFNLDRCEIDHNGRTLTLNPSSITSDDIVTLYNELDHTDKIEGTQFFAPAVRTVENFTVVSMEDRYGRSISKALGNQLFDKDFADTNNKYIDINGNVMTSSPWWASDFTYIKGMSNVTFNDLFASTVAYVAFYDEQKLFISSVQNTIVSGNGGTVSVPSNAVYTRYSSPETTNPIETFIANEGILSLPYEPYIGYFRDETLLLPVPQGESMPASKTGKIYNFISDGLGGSLQPLADDIGPIQKNFRPVDGVVDILTQNVTKQVVSIEYEILDKKTIKVASTDSGTFRYARIDVASNNNQKALVVTGLQNVGSDVPIVQILNKANTTPIITVNYVPGVETRTLFTPTDIDGYTVRFFASGVTAENQEKEYEFAVYEGDYVTASPPLPTSGVFESGNSIIMQDDYNAVRGTDVTNVFFNPDGTAKTVPFDDLANISNQQVFVSEDKQNIAYFGESLVRHSDCDHKARRYVDINEQYFVTIEGAPGTYEPYMVETFEGSGVYEAMWVLKEGVTYV